MLTRNSQSEISPQASAKIGETLRGKWRLDALLGAGGMATVYAATHRNGKRGAVKLLHKELAADANARMRFLQEGYAANKVEHAGAVSILDDDIDEDGSVFLVMELLDGESADGRAQQRPGQRLDLHEVAQIGDQLLDVLAAAHDKGIVHRDIKPENIFLTSEGGLKVLDFGIARIREMSGSPSAGLTANGGLMGTPAFMPPEQALGNWSDVGPWTDLWAVGATMFTLLSGRYVHSGETLNQLLLAAMTKPARPIATVIPGVPPSLAAVIDRALAFDAEKRWPDARAMQAALRSIPRAELTASAGTTLQSSGSVRASVGFGAPGLSTVSPTSSDRLSRRPSSSLRRYGVMAATLAAAVGFGAFLLQRGSAETHPVLAGPTPSSSVNTVVPVGTTPAPSVIPSPTSEPSAAVSAPSANTGAVVVAAPSKSAAPGKPGRPGGPSGTGTKPGKPKDPLSTY